MGHWGQGDANLCMSSSSNRDYIDQHMEFIRKGVTNLALCLAGRAGQGLYFPEIIT